MSGYQLKSQAIAKLTPYFQTERQTSGHKALGEGLICSAQAAVVGVVSGVSAHQYARTKVGTEEKATRRRHWMEPLCPLPQGREQTTNITTSARVTCGGFSQDKALPPKTRPLHITLIILFEEHTYSVVLYFVGCPAKHFRLGGMRSPALGRRLD